MGGKLLTWELLKIPSYLRKLFIETGTYKAETALEAAKYFDHVHTIELNPDLVNYCKTITDPKKITVYEGNSLEILPKLASIFKNGAVFFLDAHGGYPDDSRDDDCPVPILHELDIIKENVEGESIIIIDDVLQCTNGNPDFAGITLDKIREKFGGKGYIENDRMWIYVDK